MKWYYEHVKTIDPGGVRYRTYYNRYNLKTGVRQYCYINHMERTAGQVHDGKIKKIRRIHIVNTEYLERGEFLKDYWQKRDNELEKAMAEIEVGELLK